MTRILQSCAAEQTRVANSLYVSGLCKSYGPVPVLTGVDLTVSEGELLAVLGRSGCGKSTLLRLIAGFDRPDAGSITVDGREVAGPRALLPPEVRRIGFVTQEGNLFPHLTAAENIVFGLPRRERRTHGRAAELLELVGLDESYARRYPHELSGGQQQRIALARTLAPQPGVVLLDEPFSSLDADLRDTTRRAVTDALSAAGVTTILVTHDRAEALSLASRVAVMVDGRLVQAAAPADLYADPVDRTVAALVGAVVVLSATVADGVAACALGRIPLAAAGAAGSEAVLLRPEQIVIGPAECGVEARVLDVEFHGHDALVGLAIGGGVRVTSRCPGAARPRVGEWVGLTVRGRAAVETTGDPVV